MRLNKALPRSHQTAASEERLRSALIHAKQAALRLYKYYPNVVGISTGTKYIKNRATREHASIQFYVGKKRPPKSRKGKALPRFVYGRFKNGRVNRNVRFTTDVIEVGRVRIVCRAGCPISSSMGLARRDGTMTLVFRNKAKSDSSTYVVSCGHVIGNLDGQTEQPVVIESECRPRVTPFAEMIFSPVQAHRRIEYDIAIGRVHSASLPLPDLKIAGSEERLCSFMSKDRIVPSLPVHCALPASGAESGVVGSYGGWIRVEYRKGMHYEVDHAWMVKAEDRVKEGDSGGLIYDGKAAVGILFAASKSGGGWAWFHPLIDAFNYLCKNVSMELKCFRS